MERRICGRCFGRPGSYPAKNTILRHRTAISYIQIEKLHETAKIWLHDCIESFVQRLYNFYVIVQYFTDRPKL